MTQARLPPFDCLPSADYGARAPLKRCGTCGHLWREPGGCPACDGDEILPASTGARASGLGTAPVGRPSLGVSSLDLPAAADHESAAGLFQEGGDPLAGFSLNNPVAYAVRHMREMGFDLSHFDWPAIIAEAKACEAPVIDLTSGGGGFWLAASRFQGEAA